MRLKIKLEYTTIITILVFGLLQSAHADLLPTYIQEDINGISYYEDANNSLNYSELFDEQTMLLDEDVQSDIFNYKPSSKVAQLSPKSSSSNGGNKKIVQVKKVKIESSRNRAAIIGFNFYGLGPMSTWDNSLPSNFGATIFLEGSLSRFLTMRIDAGAEIFRELASNNSKKLRDTMPVNALVNIMLKLYPIVNNGFYLAGGIAFSYHITSTSSTQVDVPTLFWVPTASLGYRADFNWGAVDFSLIYRYFPSNTYASIWWNANETDPSKSGSHTLGLAFSIGFAI